MIEKLKQVLKGSKQTTEEKLATIKRIVNGFNSMEELKKQIFHLVGTTDPSQAIQSGITKEEMILKLEESIIPRKEFAHLIGPTEGGIVECMAFMVKNYSRLDLDPGGYIPAATELGKRISYAKNREKGQPGSVKPSKIADLAKAAGLGDGKYIVCFSKAEGYSMSEEVRVKTDKGIKIGTISGIHSDFRYSVTYGVGTTTTQTIFNVLDISKK